MRVAFHTLGCKLNQAETESLVDRSEEEGFQVVSPDDVADVYIVNTCTVTHIADRKSRHALRLARRRSPRALIVVTGCYAQRSPEALSQLADIVVDNEAKEHLPALIGTLSLEGPLRCSRRAQRSPTAEVRIRSLVKIQDGCHSRCAYCIVPSVRPQEHSLSVSMIVDQIRRKVAAGYREVVLTGTKIGSYRDNGTNLGSLLQRILRDTTVYRLRLSSLQPSEISPEFLTLWGDKRLCRHFHLALQSGSEAVLHRMRRGYSLDQFQGSVELIRDTLPQVAITTDVIVGFPGETDGEFEESYSFCRQAGFANLHVFPFSPRPGTPAAHMPEQINESVKAERNRRMLELSQRLHRGFLTGLVGQVTPVLWEKETAPGSGIYSGLTDNYLRVFARSEKPLSNEITLVRLTRLHSKGLWGAPVLGNPTSTGEVPSCLSLDAQGATSGWPLLSPQDFHIL